MKKRILLFFSFFLCCACLAHAQQNLAYTGDSGDGYAMAEISLHALPTGLDKKIQQAFQLYPNPLKTGEELFLQLEPATGFTRLLLRNASGRLLYEKEIALNEQALPLNIPTAKLPAGIYLLQLSGLNGSSTRKIILL